MADIERLKDRIMRAKTASERQALMKKLMKLQPTGKMQATKAQPRQRDVITSGVSTYTPAATQSMKQSVTKTTSTSTGTQVGLPSKRLTTKKLGELPWAASAEDEKTKKGTKGDSVDVVKTAAKSTSSMMQNDSKTPVSYDNPIFS